MIGPDDDIPYPYFTEDLDLEIELAFYVGRVGRNLTVEESQDYIAGYTIFVDPSARKRRDMEPLGPFKSKDFCYLTGPCLVTPDEINPDDLAASIAADGEVWFEGNTGHRRNFSPAQLLAFSADNETVQPGDLIACGTIGGGSSINHGKWVRVGQQVTFTIQGIGSLRHRVSPGEQRVAYVRDGLEGSLTPAMS